MSVYDDAYPYNFADAVCKRLRQRPGVPLAERLRRAGADMAAERARRERERERMTRAQRQRYYASCRRARAARIGLVNGQVALVRLTQPADTPTVTVRPVAAARGRQQRTRRVRPTCSPRSGDDPPPGHQPGPRQPRRGARA